ncbi:uncharacterized protein LOC135194907 isoform X1 [Macrobrachium nipponense]|uniref:uncharacterized protein LOC135194907 isoform X1 n=1 Tax=Macrobrachium nipponense TaxID=159736 RepID=UPI0030C88B1B
MDDSDGSSDDLEYCEVCNEAYTDDVRPRCLVCDLTFCTDCLNNSVRDQALVCPYCEQQRRALRQKGLDFDDVTVVEGETLLPSSSTHNSRTPRKKKLVLYSSDGERGGGHLVVSVHVEKFDWLNYETLILYKEASREVLSKRINEIVDEIEDVVQRRQFELDILIEANISELKRSSRQGVGSGSNKKSARTRFPRQSPIGKNINASKITLLRSMMRGFELSLEENPTYAVTQRNGRTFSARISVKDYEESSRLTYVHLHHLKDEVPSDSSRTVKHDNLLKSLQRPPVTAFLDLSWDERPHGRVYIEVASDTALGKHFKLLCTGELGPSYASSRFLQVMDKGDPVYESVIGGDYEFNDGRGGRPLLGGIDMQDKIYAHEGVSGIVWAAFQVNDGPKSAQFGITTGRAFDSERCRFLGEGVKRYRAVFGKVKSGLHVVREAAKLFDIGSVTVSDCGVVLPIDCWDLHKMILKKM